MTLGLSPPTEASAGSLSHKPSFATLRGRRSQMNRAWESPRCPQPQGTANSLRAVQRLAVKG